MMERLVLVTESITSVALWDSDLLAWHLIIQYEKGLALMKMRETLHQGRLCRVTLHPRTAL